MKKFLFLLSILMASCSTTNDEMEQESQESQESLWNFEFISNMPCDHYQIYTVNETQSGGVIESKVNYYFQRNDTIMKYDFLTVEKNKDGKIVFTSSAEASGAYKYNGNNRKGSMRYKFHTQPVSGQINSDSFGIYEDGEMWIWRIIDVEKYNYTHSPQCNQ